ncbi:ribonuclease H protein [Trifolium medium]|uniref:Ribonuclease H protein n=1 Tax=Trifolium medium TaxID=97028 RepID=A0A392NLT8_9FABA|nr:ribonuclease H protein [Trifolium medium]
MHNKVPTDENLMIRGCYMPSMCSICKCKVESSFHIFFECSFAIKTWSWLASCLNVVLQFNSIEDIWNLCDANWSPQCKVTIIAAIIYLINTVWFVRNQARFQNNLIPWNSAIALIIANTSLTGNHTGKSSSNSVRDFSFLKCFKINIHRPKATVLKEICWQPPLLNWFKCNIDGASNGNPGLASCGGIFRSYSADFVLGFAEPLGVTTSYYAELCGAMRAIEIASQNHWHNIWIETDSALVVSAFQKPQNPVPWPIRNRWKNTLHMAKSMNFIITHIFREGNQVADLLANHGLTLDSIFYWHLPPLFIMELV